MAVQASAGGISAAVLFSTRFGTTEKVARAFEAGLREAGIRTVCLSTQQATPDSLKQYDLICVGGPTEVFGATKQIKEFLKSASGTDLEGKLGFAFDTKLDSRMSGSAAKYIEHSLDDQGIHLVAHRESAIVTSRKEGGRIVGADLKAGEEERFVQLGTQVGAKAANAKALIGTV
jgi:flavodoxin